MEARAAGLILGVLLALGAACGDAYSTHLPERKAATTMLLFPDNARVGETFELHVIVFVPDSVAYVTGYDLGDGLDVLYFDSGGGTGCAAVDVTVESMPDVFETTVAFPLCLTIVAQTTTTPGERPISIDLESGGTPVIGRSTFYLLPALTVSAESNESNE